MASSGTPQVAQELPVSVAFVGTSAPLQGLGSTTLPMDSSLVLLRGDVCCPPRGLGPLPSVGGVLGTSASDPPPLALDPNPDPGPSLAGPSCLIPMTVDPVLPRCAPALCVASSGGLDFILQACVPVIENVLEVGGTPVPRGSGCGGHSCEVDGSDCSIESIVLEPCGETKGRVLPFSFRLETSEGSGPGSLALGVPLRGILTCFMSKVCAVAAALSSNSFRGGGSGGKSNKKKDKQKHKKRYDNSSAMVSSFVALFKPPDFSA